MYKATLSETDLTKIVAVKIFTVEIQPSDVDQTCGILTTVQHENLLQCFGVTQNITEAENGPGLILEYAEGGTMLNTMLDPDYRFDSRRAIVWIAQIVEGIRFLQLNRSHHNGLFHTDLNPGNILFKDAEKTIIKIAEYRIPRNMAAITTKTSETIYNDRKCAKKYTEKWNIYSLGLIMWQIITGKRIYLEDIDETELAVAKAMCEDKRRPPMNTDVFER